MHDALSSGFRLRYKLEECLGAGAMGTVFRAQQIALRRTVAIKLLRLDPESAHGRRFIGEARILASLAHPGIVKVFDFGWDSTIPFLAMEFVDGCTLRTELRSRGHFTIGESVGMALELLDATGYMHERGVLHRDFKPENILIGGAGKLFVADFGLALDLNTTCTRITEQGSVMGTALYMAPELFEGGSFNPSTDLYALGIILFELLAGTVPFDATNGAAMIQAKLSGPLRRLQNVDPSIPPAMDDLLARMLDRRPQMRPESAAAIAAELEQLAAPSGSGPRVAPPPPAPAGGRAPRPIAVPVRGPSNDTAAVRRRSVWAMSGFAGFVGVVLAATMTATRSRPPPAHPSGSTLSTPAPAREPVVALQARLDGALARFSARRRHATLARTWLESHRGSRDGPAKARWMVQQVAGALEAARRYELPGAVRAFRVARSLRGEPPANAELATYGALNDLLDLEHFFQVAAGPFVQPPPSLGADLAQPLPEPWRELPRSRLLASRALVLDAVDPIRRRSPAWGPEVERRAAWVGAVFHTRLATDPGGIPDQRMLLEPEDSEERLAYEHPAPLSIGAASGTEVALHGSDKGSRYTTFHVSIAGRAGGWRSVAVFRDAVDNRIRFVAVDPVLLSEPFRVRIEMRPVAGLHVHYRANLFSVGIVSGRRPAGH